MVSCCTLPVESSQAEAGLCTVCGARGRPVSPFTISVMAKDKELYLHPEKFTRSKYFLCESKKCNIVYFDDSGRCALDKSQVRVRVWQKEDDPEVPACYCFHNSVSSIRREILEGGSTDVVARISSEVKAENCRCEVTNPQGSCCLGNVVKAVSMAEQRASRGLEVKAIAQDVEHGRQI